MADLSRFLCPKTVAVVGGGAWCDAVLAQLDKIGFAGPVWHVHPSRGDTASVMDLPAAPDATFIGVNRKATVAVVADLAARGAGGAVAFASGFAEARAEDAAGDDLSQALALAAGDMPVLGPNCYGFLNALDGVCLWPDQHGLLPVESGVAVLMQSSNMALNVTMAARAMPVAMLACLGNQAVVGMADLARAVIADPRVTALGLHVEGFSDLRGWEALAQDAAALGKSVVVLKVGRSAQARAATVSHTASLAGEDAGADALCARLGFARVASLPVMLETLKILHMGGPLATGRLGSISCSGGEASLMADTAQGRAVTFPPLTQAQRAGLRDALGPMVALANPLDYHTYIWRDRAAMTRAWSAMVDPGLDMVLTVVDFPRADRCDAADWACAVDAAIAVHRNTGARVAMVATLPEAMPEDVALTLAAAGVVPLLGLEDALAGAEAAMSRPREPAPLLLPGDPEPGATLTEAEAKTALAAHGLAVPRAVRCPDTAAVASLAWDPDALCYPVVLKGEGVAHKTESGAVRLAIASPEALCQAALAMDAPGYLVEEMIEGAVAELLVGVVRDPAHGFLLTLGAGGTLTELLADRACLLVPSPPEAVRAALARLRTAPVLAGWRGAPAADMDAIVAAVMALQDYVIAEAEHLHEVEVNPLICTPDRVLAADALIRRAAAGSCQSVPDTTQNTAEREKLP